MTQAKTELEQAKETIEKLYRMLESAANAMELGSIKQRRQSAMALRLVLNLDFADVACKPLSAQWAKALSDPDAWDDMIR